MDIKLLSWWEDDSKYMSKKNVIDKTFDLLLEEEGFMIPTKNL